MSTIIVAVCGCSDITVVNEPSPRDLWNASAIADYDYVMVRSCFCMPAYTRPMLVQVRDGKIRNAKYMQDSRDVPEVVMRSLRTMDDWFNYIEVGRREPFFRLEVEYDADYGHPVRIFSDVSDRVADDEQTVVLTNLVAR